MANGLTQSQRRTLFAAIRSAAKDLGVEAEPYRRSIMAEESDAIWESIIPEDLRRILAMLKTHIRRRSS